MDKNGIKQNHSIPKFERITSNEYYRPQHSKAGESQNSQEFNVSSEDDDDSNSDDEFDNIKLMEEAFPCDCRWTTNDELTLEKDSNHLDQIACGKRANCINRTLFVECDSGNCPSGSHCQNQRFIILISEMEINLRVDFKSNSMRKSRFSRRQEKDMVYNV